MTTSKNGISIFFMILVSLSRLTLIAVTHHLMADRLHRYEEVLVLQDGRSAQWENATV